MKRYQVSIWAPCSGLQHEGIQWTKGASACTFVTISMSMQCEEASECSWKCFLFCVGNLFKFCLENMLRQISVHFHGHKQKMHHN